MRLIRKGETLVRQIKNLAELVSYLKHKHIDVESAREYCDKCHNDKPLNEFEIIQGVVQVYSDGSWGFFGQCVCKKCFKTLPSYFC